ncbi:hypothetical protein PFISCL1PPCAC_8297, partial [Pristionchus fissidentatus]
RAPNSPSPSMAPFIDYLSNATSCAHPSLIIGDFNFSNIDWYTDYSNADWGSMNNLISTHNWTLSFMGKTISEAYEYFNAFITELIAAYVPLKQPKSINGFPKYLSVLYDRLQRYHTYAPNSDLTHSLRKRFDKALKSFETNREIRAVQSGNTNTFFKYCKSRFKSNNSSLPGILDDKGKILLTDTEKATAFSKFFSKVQTSPLSSPLPRPMVCQTHFDLPSIFPEQILRLKLCNIETLEYRRALRDMQFIYDSIHRHALLDTTNLYSLAPLARSLRFAHGLRISIPCRLPVSISTCASRSITLWNNLPSRLVTAPKTPFSVGLRKNPKLVTTTSRIR